MRERWAYVGGLGIVGCSLTTNLDGLSNGPVPSRPSSEGGATAPQGATGGTDAGPSADAGGGTGWCATAHLDATYCADFDSEKDGAPGKLTQPMTIAAGAGVAGTAAANFVADESGGEGRITANLSGTFSAIEFGLAFYVDRQSPTNPYVRVAELQVHTAGGHHDIAVNINLGIEVTEQINDANQVVLGTAEMPDSGYAVVRIVLDQVDWKLDAFVGQTPFVTKADLPSHPASTLPTAALLYGMVSVPGPPMAVNVDDVFIDAQP